MKPNRPHARKPAAIANARWLAYATAGAASAFTYAHPHSAEATIHYSGQINLKFSFGSDTATFELDQPGDSIRLIHFSLTNSSGHAYVGVAGRVAASIVGFYNDCGKSFWASHLERGQVISFRRFVSADSALLTRAGHCHGQFNRRGVGYVGFRFNNGSGDQYGWVRIKTLTPSFKHRFILRDYAYGDVGDRIKAGQISDDQAAPDEGSLGWVALGAVGLLAWRPRRFCFG
jgi:hypothetical protein